MAVALGVSMLEVDRRVLRGEIETCAISDRNNVLYRSPDAEPCQPDPKPADEVQYA